MSNMFANESSSMEEQNTKKKAVTGAYIPDYSVTTFRLPNHVMSFIIGFIAGFVILFIFYQLLLLSIFGGFISGFIYIFVASQNSITKRRKKLRAQFADLLEAMSVAMRAGNPVIKALESAREDLSLIYAQDSDIIIELDIIIGRFYNSVTLSEIFTDWANRSQLEDIVSFASTYATIEGKAGRTDEIVRDIQEIIADKNEIEMEIETMMTSAKMEAYTMLVLPLIILGVIGYAGAGFMDALYTTVAGRLIATGGLMVFILCYFLATKFSQIEV